jgi:hypothetical protein
MESEEPRKSKVIRIVLVLVLLVLAWPALRYCAREDACADASGVWDWKTGSCLAPWCTDEGGRWVDGENYCIPRECVERGLDWDRKQKRCAETAG